MTKLLPHDSEPPLEGEFIPAGESLSYEDRAEAFRSAMVERQAFFDRLAEEQGRQRSPCVCRGQASVLSGIFGNLLG